MDSFFTVKAGTVSTTKAGQKRKADDAKAKKGPAKKQSSSFAKRR